MKANQIYIGDIKECTKYERHTTVMLETYFGDMCIGRDAIGHIETESRCYKTDAILIRIGRSKYVDLESIKTILDYIKVYLESQRKEIRKNDLAYPTSEYQLGSLFVDESSLKPYFADRRSEEISLLKLNRETRTTR